MELFSEIYNCYFQVIRSLIQTGRCISEKEMEFRIKNDCFEESILYLLPRLTEKGWGFYEKKNGFYHSRLSESFYVPLSTLQKSYLKAILLDEKIRLFLSDSEIADSNAALAGIQPLFTPEDFYYYDRFSNKDDYKDPEYRKHFQILMRAIENREYLDILYESRFGHKVHHTYLPCRLEYSIKNDCFRLLAVEARHTISQSNASSCDSAFCGSDPGACSSGTYYPDTPGPGTPYLDATHPGVPSPRKTSRRNRNPRVEILNLSRIQKVTPLSQTAERLPDLNKALQRSYYHDPVRIIIKNRRNALERAMLQFANYEKSTRKIDADTYECLIYYNKKMETELLIEVLSFGPMIKIVGNEEFLGLLRERVERQAGI